MALHVYCITQGYVNPAKAGNNRVTYTILKQYPKQCHICIREMCQADEDRFKVCRLKETKNYQMKISYLLVSTVGQV